MAIAQPEAEWDEYVEAQTDVQDVTIQQLSAATDAIFMQQL